MDIAPCDHLSTAGAVCGALDLGTNTCRLLISRVFSPYEPLCYIDSFSRVIRFGEDVHKTGLLSEAAIGRALDVLQECSRRLRQRQVLHVRSVTTQACRQAGNTKDFLDRALQETGLSLEVISPQEESALAVTGCLDLIDSCLPYGIVFDIGGGSTEVVWLHLLPSGRIKILDSISLPYGILALGESVCTADHREGVVELISNEVNQFALRNEIYPLIDRGDVQMIGASGTITTLAAIVLNLSRYDRHLVHKVRLYREDFLRLLEYLKRMNREDLFAHPCIGPRRADFVMGGLAILQGIYKILTVNSIVVADRGLREGILRELATKVYDGIAGAVPVIRGYSSAA